MSFMKKISDLETCLNEATDEEDINEVIRIPKDCEKSLSRDIVLSSNQA